MVARGCIIRHVNIAKPGPRTLEFREIEATTVVSNTHAQIVLTRELSLELADRFTCNNQRNLLPPKVTNKHPVVILVFINKDILLVLEAIGLAIGKPVLG
jgi:hypothetical protein